MSSTAKPQNKVVSHKDYTIKLARLYDKEGFGYTEVSMFSKDGKLVFFEKSTVLNPLAELALNYKRKLDDFIETKFPKLTKGQPEAEEEKPKRGRKPSVKVAEAPAPAPKSSLDQIIATLETLLKQCQELRKSVQK